MLTAFFRAISWRLDDIAVNDQQALGRRQIMPMRAVFHLATGGLYVAENLLGNEFSVEREGKHLKIQFPALDDHTFEAPPGRFPVTGFSGTGAARACHVTVVRVIVEFDGTLLATDLADDEGEKERSVRGTQAFALLDGAVRIGQSTLADFLNHVRVRHQQAWLALSGDVQPILGAAVLYDRDGNRVPIGYPALATVGRSGVDPVTQESLDLISRDLANTAPPNLADLLLADAKFLAWESQVDQHREALLLTAVACETKVKETLRRTALPEQLSLVDVLLNNPRDYSMAAQALFDDAMEAVIGRSLRTDNRPLFNEVGKLFKNRNDIAHGKQEVPASVVKDHVRTAVAVFQWLESLS